MRYAFYYGVGRKMTDFVIGVHPRHARFYVRSFGFDFVGDERTYEAVNHHPVVMLRGNIEANMKIEPLHPALDYFVKHPVEITIFDQRFQFAHDQIAGSKLEQYLIAHRNNLAED